VKAPFLLAGILGLLVTFGAIEYLVPPFAAHFYREEYQTEMFQCDHVMREHFIAKKAVEAAPGEMTIRNLEAAEISLVTCQDYDRLRKKLQVFGVSEAKLGLMGVEALEAKSKDVSRFVEIHEIRY
jgi:hypothetical protein